MSVAVEAPDDLRSPRLARLRQAVRQRPGSGRGTAVVVAVLYLLLALLDGGTEPGLRAFAALALWIAVIVGLVLGVWPRAPVPRPALVAGMALGGFAALAGLSLAWAGDNGAAFSETIRVLAYLGLFVSVVLASSPGRADRWLGGLALGLGGVALVAIVSRTQPGLIEASVALREQLPPAQVRLSYPSGYWNGLGAAMAIAIVLFTWLAAEARTARGRALAAGAIPVASLVLFLTSSRGAVLAMGVGVAVLIVAARSRRPMLATLFLGGLGAAAVILLALAVAPDIVSGALDSAGANLQGAYLLALVLLTAAAVGVTRHVVGARLGGFRWRPPRWAIVAALAGVLVLAVAAVAVANPVPSLGTVCQEPAGDSTVTGHFASTSSSGRCQYWSVGFEAFLSAPVAGIGAGGYEAWWGEHHTRAQPVTFAHSLPVGALAELGLIGFVLIIGFLGVPLFAGVRARRDRRDSTAAAAVAVLVAGTFAASVDWMWEFPTAFVPVLIACALLTGPALSRVSAAPRSRFGFGVAALLVGWLTLVAAVLSFFGESRIDASERALRAGDLETAVSRADTASSVLPWDAEPYVLKAAALEGAGDLDRAAAAIEAAIERAPGDWQIWQVAARIYAAADQPDRAAEASALAERLNPSTEPTEQ